ncbi:PIG-L family deacetylase [Candidatus Poribacteria bacterium]|nr:PIG-L family deacetylase [Candidatus Poribacteria bacterium]
MAGENKILMVLPHQDDEMFIYHRIRYFVKRGDPVFIVWVTDGAANTDEIRQTPLIKWCIPILAKETDETIRRVRRAESLLMMKHLGVPEDRLRFLDFPSGKIKGCFQQIVDLLTDLFHQLNPTEIYTVAYDHSEFEHDACHAAVRFAARDVAARLYEFPVLNVYRGWPRVHFLVPYSGGEIRYTPFTRQEEKERLRLFRQVFKSQWFVWWLSQNPFMRPIGYSKRGEPYRPFPDYDYLNMLTGAKVMYLPKPLRFEDFREVVRNYIERTSS